MRIVNTSQESRAERGQSGNKDYILDCMLAGPGVLTPHFTEFTELLIIFFTPG